MSFLFVTAIREGNKVEKHRVRGHYETSWHCCELT